MIRYITMMFMISCLGLVSCSTTSDAKPLSQKNRENKAAQRKKSPRARLALQILKHPNITFMRKQVSGVNDGADVYSNLLATSRGYSAKRSRYGGAPGGYRSLDIRMLRGMKAMADAGYRFNVTSILGGSHSSNSRHYAGLAFDVNYINRVKVGRRGCPHWKFQKLARRLGATEVLGPGKRGHSGHVHIAWPRRKK